MSEQDKTEKLIQDGERVAKLLGDPAVKDAVERVRANLFVAFKNTTDHAATTGVWAQARALDLVMQELRGVADAGFRAKTVRDRQRGGR